MSTAEAAPLSLYHSPRGVLDHQAKGAARVYFQTGDPELGAAFAIWDTGTGKSHLAMVSAALLFEDGLIDLVLLVCEVDKVKEWVDDFGVFTDLSVERYHVDAKRRAKIRANLPQVLVATYETFKIDCAKFPPNRHGRGSRTLGHGPLLEVIADKRVLVVYDEITPKLGGSRTSDLHRAHEHLLTTLRRTGECRALALTAFSIEGSEENFYNTTRLVAPHLAGTVEEFEAQHVLVKDQFFKWAVFKNMTPDDPAREPGVMPFTDKIRSIAWVKRKTDPDLVGLFPEIVPEVTYVELDAHHRDLYDTIEDVFATEDEWEHRKLFTVLRLVAGYPLALSRSKGKLAQRIAATVGVDALAAMGSAKRDRLIAKLAMYRGQRAPVVVFTFFANTILPLLANDLRDAGFRIAEHHGGLSTGARERARDDFKDGRCDVLLSSDSGQRGINLPNALYVVNFESALTHAGNEQRVSRIVRLNSEHPSVTTDTLVALDTLEENIAGGLVLRRNQSEDRITDALVEASDDEGEDGARITAAQRRELMDRSRKAVAGAARPKRRRRR